LAINVKQSDRRLPTELAALNNFSMCGIDLLVHLYRLGQYVTAQKIEGDFVECGVCNGGSAAAIACAFRGTKRHVWLYDSFEGLPEPNNVDGTDARDWVGKCLGSEDRVREALTLARFPEEDYTIRKGWFQDTFHQALPGVISLLHIDADWYESVMFSLDTFYDRVSDGGIVVLNDFGHWEGCREAFYDFAQKRNLRPVLERVGHTEAYWIKGRTHNRGFSESRSEAGEIRSLMNRYLIRHYASRALSWTRL